MAYYQNYEETAEDIMKNNPEQECIICGEYAPNGLLCRDCYYEMKDYKDDFEEQNYDLSDINDYYYNLKNKSYRTNNEDYIYENCIKLFALANLAYELYNKTSLITKVKDDVENIVDEKLSPAEEDLNIELDLKKDINILKDAHQNNNTILLRTIDGHRVKSRGEKIIDDILFMNRIPHAYSMTIAEIDTKIDRSIESDWFIPIIGSGKGIYIEYWGMDKQDYNDNKKEKTELYKKYDLPLIQIEKDEIDDSQALNIRIRREINSLAKEKYKTIVDF